MPFTPDPPFPKAPGHSIMAKDWNDAVVEVQRLDTAKVNRAGADTLTGPLTIGTALGVGTTMNVGQTLSVGTALTVGTALAVGTTLAVGPAGAAVAGTRLHVVDTANPVVARLQSVAAFGAARLELWSDPRGSASEWRPGYIESFDAGNFTGGLRFVTNGAGQAARQGSAEQLRLVNGLAGFGVTDPGFRIDALGRIRIRQSGGDTAGLWLHQATPAANRAFIGMRDDDTVGLYGTTSGWSLLMDVTSGNLTQVAAANPAVLRIQSRGAFGVARVEMWSDPPGTANEWRPGYIESFDTGGFTGGLKFVTNGSGSKTGAVEQLRIWNGTVGVGVTDPGFRLDVGGRGRFRDGGGTAGFWFYHSGAAAPKDRAFVGMSSDNSVGFWGNTGAQWGLTMDTTSGDVGVKGVLAAASDAKFAGVIGTNGFQPRQGLPTGWGGGVHTWDIAVEGTGRSKNGWQSGAWDLAEKFNNYDKTLEPGEVVVADPDSPERLIRSTSPYQGTLLGVISENPGFLLGVSWEDPKNPTSLALAGRVPVKVSLEGGPIRIGDHLTSSSTPGVAMKASGPGRVIGMALEAFAGAAKEKDRVVAFINPHWRDGR